MLKKETIESSLSSSSRKVSCGGFLKVENDIESRKFPWAMREGREKKKIINRAEEETELTFLSRHHFVWRSFPVAYGSVCNNSFPITPMGLRHGSCFPRGSVDMPYFSCVNGDRREEEIFRGADDERL